MSHIAIIGAGVTGAASAYALLKRLAEFSGTNRDTRADRIVPLVRWCERLFPDMPTRSIIPLAGFRPMTPSMLPRVGRGRGDRVFYNTGHGHLGWTPSGATAEMLAARLSETLGNDAA